MQAHYRHPHLQSAGSQSSLTGACKYTSSLILSWPSGYEGRLIGCLWRGSYGRTSCIKQSWMRAIDMPRYTSQGWYCLCNQKNSPDSRRCCKCGFNRYQRNAQVSSSERAVIYVNPATGERRTPPRADQAMPEIYAQQGFERQEIMSMTQFERETGLVHEATNFSPGNEPSPAPPVSHKPDPKVVHDLAVDMAAAVASGPFTGGLPEPV